jgi:hypothetical protein
MFKGETKRKMQKKKGKQGNTKDNIEVNMIDKKNLVITAHTI